MKMSSNLYKDKNNANPISSNVFCADPTAVEYNGRLYVYGTNDHEQFIKSEKNTYEKIKSLVCFSTEDMINWTYHGEINIGKIAPWIYNSWAPSICKRVEDDGLTHFYLYFSNSGCGVGVITATNPIGPWTDPLGKPLIDFNMPEIDSPNPFDPGVCIDDKGDGWLSFGGGVVKGKTKALPGSSKIVKLGKDMISLDSEIVSIEAPYFFEASELNFINGTYVYTFNNSWDPRDEWPLLNKEPSPSCSMAYMTTKTPLISDSWEYKGHYFKNPGQMGFTDSNNHTHFEKFKDNWYMFYHTLCLEVKAGNKGGFRSLCVDKLEIDENSVEIKNCQGTYEGVKPVGFINPFEKISGTCCFTSADIWYENTESPEDIVPVSKTEGSWFMVKNVDFEKGAAFIQIVTKGTGYIDIYIDETESVARINLENKTCLSEIKTEFSKNISGIHDIYFIFSEKDITLKEWKILK